jgi:uncharacterized protein (TIGR02145 family)
MKKKIIALGIALTAMANLQAQDTIYVYQKVGGIIKHAVSNVDSVIFYKPTVAGVTNQLTVTDIDGNAYNIVTIGGQAWMKENLKVTKYKDGTTIPLVTATGAWVALTTPGYSFYNNSVTGGVYGALYNWYTVNTGKLCPTGWHVPSTTEWTTLETFLGGASVAGGKLKETGTSKWFSPNTGATNETGFTALPGGARNYLGTMKQYWQQRLLVEF